MSIDTGAVARANEILRTEAGSGVHGLAIAGVSDHDEAGVFVEPAEHVVGLAGPVDHHTWRDRPEGARSEAGDRECTLYSLRKFLRLAVAGNPNLLLVMCAPESSVYRTTALGDELRALAPAFLSRDAARRAVGYLDGQVAMLLGRGRQKDMPKRPELVAAHGYDTKFASHALRLGLQALELTEHARLTLPMPEADRERVLRVKSGGVPDLDAVLAEVTAVRDRAEALLEAGRTPLPEAPDTERISAWSVDAHRRHWDAMPAA
ncbi:Predicted nucleotidyltransferase [Glycomyces sambucus]|uniref:Predicted nucleotidyltransferase n=1 Tax=Glycomyces sambucus TaxID=380244 RepID=A0A1G9FRY5_9ACTN|nr:nucleotidyltransferase domain-containing protein [Glycomyces sambucus]SDK90873.1 Predicted nucleotidyltransferase [Glycomyces sambucus]